MNATFGTRLSGIPYRDRKGAYAVAFDGAGNVALHPATSISSLPAGPTST